MSFLDIPTENELPEQAPASAGEHELRIIGMERKQGNSKKDGAPYDSINIALEVIDELDRKAIYHTIFLPKSDDAPDRRDQALRRIRYFQQAFKLPSQIDLDNLDMYAGYTGFGLLELEQNEEYGDRNRVKRFVVPK